MLLLKTAPAKKKLKFEENTTLMAFIALNFH